MDIKKQKRIIGFSAIAIIMLNFAYQIYYFITHKQGTLLFWVVLAVVSVIAFPLLKRLNRLESENKN